ncbi:hypothetical protein BpHYR1_005573 [Brachionus plicatilis]|uniref:Uncharacterized protein n=1 Tax=Brachionus plicatilis TaxID=10195 RepID=A0A3M7R9U7_BRAPC|nr:hypothetical protein BpHYR1_005573 [Brachionus plicatilis]
MAEEKENTPKWLSCEKCSNWVCFSVIGLTALTLLDLHIINRGTKGVTQKIRENWVTIFEVFEQNG